MKSITDECRVAMARAVYSRSNWIGTKVERPWSALLIRKSLVWTHLNLLAYYLTSSFMTSGELAARTKLCCGGCAKYSSTLR